MHAHKYIGIGTIAIHTVLIETADILILLCLILCDDLFALDHTGAAEFAFFFLLLTWCAAMRT